MAEATSPVEISEAYKAPAQKSVSEILAADAEDESLRRYKEALLGGGVAASVVLGMVLLCGGLLINNLCRFRAEQSEKCTRPKSDVGR